MLIENFSEERDGGDLEKIFSEERDGQRLSEKFPLETRWR
jgi:hypothetical protein